jgi:hypothetical protein
MREFCGEPYVWKTAKYTERGFVVNKEGIDEYNIVSIINDNRKNYVKCSCCGKIFPKNGKKFAKHQEAASTIAPCLKCRKLKSNEITNPEVKYVANDDGTYTKKSETIVNLVCNYSLWTNFNCNSSDAIKNCKYRQCGSAKAQEICDTFTMLPGLFDDIITVDKILENGDAHINWSDEWMTEYQLDEEICLCAHVNNLGIVDRFYIDHPDGCYYFWYSKKYDEFFWTDCTNYIIWNPQSMRNEDKDRIKNCIRKLYK